MKHTAGALALRGSTARWAVSMAAVVGAALLLAANARAYVSLLSFNASFNSDGSVLVQWVTATEVNTSGFALYRSESFTGPWNTTPITWVDAQANVAGASYSHTDPAANLDMSKTYWYKLQEVASDQTVTWHGPVSASFGTPTPTATATSPASATSTASRTATRTATSRPAVVGWTATPTNPPTATRQFGNTPVTTPGLPAQPLPSTPQPQAAQPSAPQAPQGPAQVSKPTGAPMAATLPLLVTATLAPPSQPPPTQVVAQVTATSEPIATSTPGLRPSVTASTTPVPPVFVARQDEQSAQGSAQASRPALPETEASPNRTPGLAGAALVLVVLAVGAYGMRRSRRGLS